MAMTEAERIITEEILPGYVFHDLVKEGIVERLLYAPIYEKFGRFYVTVATEDEEVVTVIDGVKYETTNPIKKGDHKVYGSTGEIYGVSPKSFPSRFRKIPGEENWYDAIGKSRMIQNPFGHAIAIPPRWGKIMYGDVDCHLALPLDYDTEEPNLPLIPYIVDNIPFQRTYRLKQ